MTPASLEKNYMSELKFCGDDVFKKNHSINQKICQELQNDQRIELRGFGSFSLRKRNKNIKGLALTDTLDKYAQTGKEYTEILEQIIKQNRLNDFETVQLTNSIVKLGFFLFKKYLKETKKVSKYNIKLNINIVKTAGIIKK